MSEIEIGGEIELLDVESPSSSEVGEVVANPKSSRALTLLGAIAAIAAIFFLSSGENTPAEETSPSTTTAPDTTTSTASAIAAREAAVTNLGVLLGDGPQLQWHRVDSVFDTAWFQWVDGAFVGDNGSVEFTVQLSDGDASLTERPSPRVDFPGYQLQGFGGNRLLVPSVPVPDHLLVLDVGDEPLRVELPKLDDNPEADLIQTTVWLQGLIVGDRFVAIVSRSTEVDVPALAVRVGRELDGAMYVEASTDRVRLHTQTGTLDPIMFADVDFSEAEIEQLQQANSHGAEVFSIDIASGVAETVDLPGLEWLTGPPNMIDDEWQLRWTDGSRGSWMSSTSDGLSWSTETASNAGWLMTSGSQLFDMGQETNIRRSLDGGATWEQTRLPSQNTQRVVAGEVIVLGRQWSSSFSGEEVAVETASENYELVLIGGNPDFEIRTLSGDVVLDGHLWDPFQGGRRDDESGDHVFSDPETGTELLRASAMSIAIATATASPTKEIALARWAIDEEAPEWRLAAPSEFFGVGALTVEFTPGDDNLLAVVTTAGGYELYIADAGLGS